MPPPAKPAIIPSLIYGTAWKKDSTTALVKSALQSGFRAIDTAAQPKHYREDLVGEGIRQFLRENSALRRTDLYIQTKYTAPGGQDPHNLPPGYDITGSTVSQIRASIASSLHNLRPSDQDEEGRARNYIDCVLLHSPLPTPQETLAAWSALETSVPHEVLSLGLSNCYHLPLLQHVYAHARVKPAVVQNRFYRDTGYDRGIREFCREKGIRYQSFWTLTANPDLLRGQAVGAVAREIGVGKAVALYALVLALGDVSVLDGTTNVDRMKEDLEGIEKVAAWRDGNVEAWRSIQEGFETELG